MKTPQFASHKELLGWLVQNKAMVLATKMAEMKRADAVDAAPLYLLKEAAARVEKTNKPVTAEVDQIKVEVIINTTNLMDSHHDVHLPGLWNKSLKENRSILHLQEHQLAFDKIIADRGDLKAYVQTLTWKEIGFNYPGTTEALTFESVVKAGRNAQMFNEYKQGRVQQHSVGMRYVKIDLAVNDKDWPDEYKVWQKYIDQVANRQDAEEAGYFFPVHEAKVIEGSAVPLGSNWATPTRENNMEPPEDTPAKEEPIKVTPDVMQLITNRKILI